MRNSVKIGDHYNQLTVVRRVGTKSNKTPIWLCQCDCGNFTEVSSEHLKDSSIKSCGCFRVSFMKSCKSKENTFVIRDDYVIGYDCKGNSFLFDLEDLDRVKTLYWSVNARGYVRNVKTRTFLHRFILGTPPNLVVDHKNHDTTDNRKKNIWSCTQSDNMRNQKRFVNKIRGVTNA